MEYSVAFIGNNPECAYCIKRELENHKIFVNMYFMDSTNMVQISKVLDFCKILFIDTNSPGINSVELVRYIKNTYANIRIISIHPIISEKLIVQVLEAGASGYLFSINIHEIADIFDIIIKGGAIISPIIALHVLKKLKKNNCLDALAEIEKQLLYLLTTGVNLHDASALINISFHMAGLCINNIYNLFHTEHHFQMINNCV